MISAFLTLWPILLALLAALAIAAYVWQLRPQPGSRSLAGMMLAVALWLASSLGEHTAPGSLVAPGSPAAFIWLGLFASLLAPVFWLVFAASYTGRDAWLNRRSRLLLFAFPFLLLLVAWGNGAHNLLFDSPSLVQPEPYRVYSLRPGPAWLVAEIAGYLLVLAGGSLLAASLRRANRAGRERIPLLPLILLAALPPAVLRLLYLLGGGPFPGVDLAPVGAVVTGACLAYALARYDVSDLVPIAREAVIASMQDGVLVLDVSGQVAVINSAAQEMLGLCPGSEGRSLNQALGGSSSALLPILERDTAQAEVALGGVDESGACWAEVRVSLLLDRRGRRTGRLVVLRDITEARRFRDELLEANRRLEVELLERRRVEEELRFASMHDALTGLYNRAYFEEEMQRLAEGRSYPVSIVMADTDRLKEINDRLGHATGDELLRQAAHVLRSVFRAQDVVARIGGDEFCILMPDTPLSSAILTLDRIRARAAQVNVERPDLPLSLSLGAYTAEANESLAEAFRRADQLMYHNKQARKAGRDTRG